MASCAEFLASEGKCMGQPLKSSQLKVDLHPFTPVEMLGEIFCGSVLILVRQKLTTWGTPLSVLCPFKDQEPTFPDVILSQ